MAGLWIKWMKGLAMKREVLVMSAALGVDRHEVAGRLMTLWEWCDDNLSAHDVDESGNATVTLGALPERTIDAVAGVTGFAQAMSDAGWMQNVDGLVVFPNFCRHNGETAKTRALTASRVASHKAGKKRQGNGEGNGSSVTSALPREEKRREEVLEEKEADAEPSQTTTPKTDEEILAQAVKLVADWKFPTGCEAPRFRGALSRWVAARYRQHGWFSEINWDNARLKYFHWTPDQWFEAITSAAVGGNKWLAEYAAQDAGKKSAAPPKSKTKELTAP